MATRIEAAQLWHREIRNHHIGGQRARRFEERSAITDAADDVVRGFEQATPRGEQPNVVIRQEDTRSAFLRQGISIISLGHPRYVAGYG